MPVPESYDVNGALEDWSRRLISFFRLADPCYRTGRLHYFETPRILVFQFINNQATDDNFRIGRGRTTEIRRAPVCRLACDVGVRHLWVLETDGRIATRIAQDRALGHTYKRGCVLLLVHADQWLGDTQPNEHDCGELLQYIIMECAGAVMSYNQVPGLRTTGQRPWKWGVPQAQETTLEEQEHDT